MKYEIHNLFSNWYLTEAEARDKGTMDIYYQVKGMRWYEKNNLILEIKNDNKVMFNNTQPIDYKFKPCNSVCKVCEIQAAYFEEIDNINKNPEKYILN
jgi:hypothetical protein